MQRVRAVAVINQTFAHFKYVSKAIKQLILSEPGNHSGTVLAKQMYDEHQTKFLLFNEKNAVSALCLVSTNYAP